MFSWTPKTLCPEVFEMIVEDFSIQDKTKLLILNKEWNTFMEGNTHVWKNLDFGMLESPREIKSECELLVDITLLFHRYGARANAGIRQIRVYGDLLYCDWQALELVNWQSLTKLCVSTLWGSTLYSLEHLARNLPNLEVLLIDCFLTVDVVVLFLENCLKMKTASFWVTGEHPRELPCTGRISPGLYSLKINLHQEDPWIGDVLLGLRGQTTLPDGLLANAANLQTLVLRERHTSIASDFRHLTKLWRLHMPWCKGCTNLLLPPSLEELMVSMDYLQETSIITPVPNLRFLQITSECDGFDLHHLSMLCEAIGPRLAELHIVLRGVPEGFEEDIVCCLYRSKKVHRVKNLEIISDGTVTDTLLDAVMLRFPRLEYFNLCAPANGITLISFIVFVEGLPSLKRFRIPIPEDDDLVWATIREWAEISSNIIVERSYP